MEQSLKEKYMQLTIELAKENIKANQGGPFGAMVANEDTIISKGTNLVTSTNDPTAHAEIMAIRKAGNQLEHFDLSGYTLFASCEPCPMCLGAIYWARISKVYFAATKGDAAAIQFDDHNIYEELAKNWQERSVSFEQLLRDQAIEVFKEWENKEDKILY